MRFRVILEIEGPEPGTFLDGTGAKLARPEEWIWQDILTNGSGHHNHTVCSARVLKAGICGNCERAITFADYLCNRCRADSIQGSTIYDSGLSRRRRK